MRDNEQRELKYIELKTGWNDNGPAWIGFVKESRSGRMVYFNDHAFQKRSGEYSNYVDVETREEYWISGVKKTVRTDTGRAEAPSRSTAKQLKYINH